MGKFVTRWLYASVGDYENIVEEGWFWNKKRRVVKQASPRTANYDEFADGIAKIYNDLDFEGYDVVNIIPLAIGASESVHAKINASGQNTYLGETGFSVTRGAIVVGRKRDN